MRIRIIGGMLASLAILLAGVGALPMASAEPAAVDASLVARGAYLAKAADCAGCHTATGGGAAYAGGLGMASPFGTIVSSNITPDPRFGIGAYRYEDFARALRNGVTPDNKHLYPAMPYAAFSKIDDQDMRALYAYMMHGVKPVARPAPPTHVPFPFNQRWLLIFWKMLFKPNGVYQARNDRDAQWNRGAYLVQGMGHCGACHTPRGIGFQERGNDETSLQFLAGAVNDHWFAANLTGDRASGLGRVGEADLAAFLKTGHGAGLVAYGSMVEEIEDSTQYLSDDDLSAIARYLKSLPAQRGSGNFVAATKAVVRTPAQGNHLADQAPAGAPIYQSFCAQCHQADGSGIPQAFPKLAGNPTVLNDDTTSLIRLLVEGGNSPNTLHGPARQNMPAFAGQLSDLQIAQVLTFIRTAWGNDAGPVTTNDVQTLRSELHK
ncbi:MAG: c-type cytochrome [Janthinobacterium lividum]